MKFICLHGAIGSSQNFKVQLDPLLNELESDGSATFVFIQGQVPVHPPPGFQEYFGPGPHWRFLNDEGYAETAMLERIREFPDAESAEDTLRALLPKDHDAKPFRHVAPSLDYVKQQIEKEGDVEGIVGYSEGALVAASVLLDDARRSLQTGKPRRLKMGLFFSGWPTVDPSGSGFMFSDETAERVPHHSVHVIGATDPYLQGSLALYNLFDEDTALLFDHGKGHTLPRDTQTVKELADALRAVIKKSGQFPQ